MFKHFSRACPSQVNVGFILNWQEYLFNQILLFLSRSVVHITVTRTTVKLDGCGELLSKFLRSVVNALFTPQTMPDFSSFFA